MGPGSFNLGKEWNLYHRRFQASLDIAGPTDDAVKGIAEQTTCYDHHGCQQAEHGLLLGLMANEWNSKYTQAHKLPYCTFKLGIALTNQSWTKLLTN